MAAIEYCLILSFISVFLIIALQRLAPTVMSTISNLGGLTILLQDDERAPLGPTPESTNRGSGTDEKPTP